jgi:hypothetical protein
MSLILGHWHLPLPSGNDAQKFLTKLSVVAEAAKHTIRHEVCVWFVYATRRNAMVRRFDNHADTQGFNDLVDGICNRAKKGLRLFGNSEPRQHGSGYPLGTAAGERERFHQCRPDLLVQLLAQKLPEKLGRFFNAHALDHASYENQPIGIGQRIGCSLDKLNNLSLRHCSFRIVILC